MQATIGKMTVYDDSDDPEHRILILINLLILEKINSNQSKILKK